ncbi:hypothetical protein [Microlunatus speluncae]|uniref:hypothetical protein n=1 Tax=Microlunatus speluncae TaxID=2594267 RepID=UPI0012667790|nr:hypothetical protein [Microlunatus speluncae]
MSTKEYLTPDGSPLDEAAHEPGAEAVPPARAIGPRQAWLLVAAGLLLAPALLLAVLSGSDAPPEVRLALWAAPGALVVLLVAVAARSAPPRTRSVIIGTVTAVVVAGVLATVIVPGLLPRPGPRGTGIIWTAGSDAPARSTPLAVLDGTAVLAGAEGVLFLDLADGRVAGQAPATEPGEPAEAAERPVVAGAGVLIKSAAGFRRYDLTGRPTWPEPVPADRVVAHDDGITALAGCSGGQCLIEGYDDAGARVWRFEAAYDAFHQPGRDDSDTGALPSQLAVQDRFAPTGAPRWLLYSAASGARTGAIEGKAIQLIDQYAITLAGADFGPCLVRLSTGPTEAVDCVSPWSTQVRNGLLIVEQKHGFASVLRPGPGIEGGELFETAAASGRLPDTDFGTIGRARLTNDRLEGWHWRPFRRSNDPPAWRSEPLATEPAAVVIAGTAVAVLADAPAEPFGIGGPESRLIVFDLTDGAETARLRFPRLPLAELRDRLRGAGDGRVLLSLPDHPPMLLGRPL